MSAPEGFKKLPKDVRCRCIQLWQEPDGTFWCCNAGKVDLPQAPTVDADARRLKIAQELFERFCGDLLRDPAMAKVRLIAGIQIAIRDGVN